MEFDSVINKRKSVRSFRGKRASWKDVVEAIDAALQAPFAGNHNNLKFLSVEDPSSIAQIAKLCEQLWINESGFLVIVCSDDRHLENLFGERGRIYSRQQAGAAIENLLLKLTDLGLAGCWVGSYPDEIIRQLLKIPAHIQIEAIIPIGYEKSGVKQKSKKKPFATSMYWERWNIEKRPTFFKEPDLEKVHPI